MCVDLHIMRAILITTQKVVTHHFLEEHNIHEFIFAESSRQAMDEYIGTIYDIYDEHFKGKPIMLIILDIHLSGMLVSKVIE